MNIKETAYQLASVNMKNKCSPAELEEFAEALVAELAKENEPFCFVYPEIANAFIKVSWVTAYRKRSSPEQIALYPLPPTVEQVEQRVAEACAKVCTSYYERYDGTTEDCFDTVHDAAKAIQSGKWREYL